MLCGIDEAGRGCIVGPLVLCGVVITPEDSEKLRELGAKDSKLLSPKEREKLYELLTKSYKFHVIAVPPDEIDFNVLGVSSNLNMLEGKKIAEIINVLDPASAVVDCPSPNVKAYTCFLQGMILNKSTKLILEHKADVNHPVVSAASIIAKVQRDRHIHDLRAKLGIDFGSGYLSDPKTQKFLTEHWATYPEVFRHSWAPYQEKLAQKKKKNLFQY